MSTSQDPAGHDQDIGGHDRAAEMSGVPELSAVPGRTLGSEPVAEVVMTTTQDREVAERLASQIVEQRFGACVQIDGPVLSVYRWEGQVETASEWRLMVKTTCAAGERLTSWLIEHHPYDEPEVIRLPIHGGSAGYLGWLADEVSPAE